MKVGELAREVGVSVRALHYYDETGLLRPSGRTPSGHRFYNRADVLRLQQIMALQRLRLSLDEIRLCLDHRRPPLVELLERHLKALRDEVEAQRRVLNSLENLVQRLRGGGGVDAAEVLQLLETTRVFERYFTPEQRDALSDRAKRLGEARIRAAESEWKELLSRLREEMECGTDPRADVARSIFLRSRKLIAEFTGGDRSLERSLASLYASEPRALEHAGMDPAIQRFLCRIAEGLNGRAHGGQRGD